MASDRLTLRGFRTLPLLACLVAPAASFALTPLGDDALSSTSAEAGISLYITNTTGLGTTGANSATGYLTAGNTNLFINPNNGKGATSASFVDSGLQILPIGDYGASTASPMTTTISVDSGADANGAGFQLTSNWSRSRFLSNYLLLLGGDAPAAPYTVPAASATGSSAYSFGRIAVDGTGSFKLATSKGLLNTGAIDPSMQLRFTEGSANQFGAYSTTPGYGQFYYQQNVTAGSPQLVLDNIYADLGFNTVGSSSITGGMIGACTSSGTCGVTNNQFAAGSAGLYFVTPELIFNFTFNLNMMPSPANSLQTSSAAYSYLTGTPQALTVWGWTGDFSGLGGSTTNNGAGLLIGGGGVWANSSASYNANVPGNGGTGPGCTSACTALSRADGINLAFHGNYDPTNFNWWIGRPGEVLQFGNWETIPGASWSLNAPNITLGVVNAGQGPGGLWWGGNDCYTGTGGTCGSYTKQIMPTVGGVTGSSLTQAGQYLDTNETGGKSPNNTNGVTGANTALALLIRNLSLQAFSTSVSVYDDIDQTGTFSGTGIANTGAAANRVVTEPWALIYTLGQMDANIYLYPFGTSFGNSNSYQSGLTADVLLMTQSFSSGYTNPTSGVVNPLGGNSNFMIGEQCFPGTAGQDCNLPGTVNGGSTPAWCNPSCLFGVGLTQADWLWAANNLHLNLSNNAPGYNSSTQTYGRGIAFSAATYGPGIEFATNDYRSEVRGFFAGGFLQSNITSTGTVSYSMNNPGNQTTSANIAENQEVAVVVDINQESNSADFTVSPQTTSASSQTNTDCYGSQTCASGRPYTYLGVAGHITFTSPGTPNNTTGNSTDPSATTLDIQPTAGGCKTNTDFSCDGSYISLAEPYQPTKGIRWADVQGDVTILGCTTAATCNGALTSPSPSGLMLISAGDPYFNDAKERLRIAATAAIGSMAGTNGAPLSTIVKLDSAVAFPTGANGTLSMANSPNALGTIVVPAAQVYMSLTLRPQ